MKRFRKAQCPIVERLTNSLMMHGRNNGKKLMAVSIVKHSFEIIHLLTGEVSFRYSVALSEQLHSLSNDCSHGRHLSWYTCLEPRYLPVTFLDKMC